jgi:hypothetical protein
MRCSGVAPGPGPTSAAAREGPVLPFKSRPVLAALVLTLVGIWWMDPSSLEQLPRVVQCTSFEEEQALDSGTTGLQRVPTSEDPR